MSQKIKSQKYETNYAVLERITESLNKDEVGIDQLVEKTKEALNAARICMDILNQQKGEFKKLETEFSQLLKKPIESEPIPENTINNDVTTPHDQDEIDTIGHDDPF